MIDASINGSAHRRQGLNGRPAGNVDGRDGKYGAGQRQPAIGGRIAIQPDNLTMPRCAFLAPDIVELIKAGRQPLELTPEKLLQCPPLISTEQPKSVGLSNDGLLATGSGNLFAFSFVPSFKATAQRRYALHTLRGQIHVDDYKVNAKVRTGEKRAKGY